MMTAVEPDRRDEVPKVRAAEERDALRHRQGRPINPRGRQTLQIALKHAEVWVKSKKLCRALEIFTIHG